MSSPFVLPPPVRQFYVRGILVAARQTVLHEVLLKTLGEVDADVLSAEIRRYAPKEGRQALQAEGIRDEFVFATPAILKQRPSLLGYYRLLLGISQKAFYHPDTGMAGYKVLEVNNALPEQLAVHLGDLCDALDHALGELATGVEGGLTPKDIDQLPLLMLGAQADGSWRTRIGQKATKAVFEALKDIIKEQGVGRAAPGLAVMTTAIVLGSIPRTWPSVC